MAGAALGFNAGALTGDFKERLVCKAQQLTLWRHHERCSCQFVDGGPRFEGEETDGRPRYLANFSRTIKEMQQIFFLDFSLLLLVYKT